MSEPRKTDTPAIDRIHRLVDQLARPHKEKVWQLGKNVELPRAALITQIRQAMYGDLGRTESGKSAAAQERSVIDTGAFTMYEDITGRIESFHRAITGKPKRDTAEATLIAWYVEFDSRYRRRAYSASQVDAVLDQLRRFANRIRSYLDQPHIKPLEGLCPQCKLTHVIDGEGAAQHALYATYYDGKAPTVKCRNPECEAEWAGDADLIQLGRYLGATVDEKTLTEMGVLR